MTIYAIADEQDSFYRYLVSGNTVFSTTVNKDTNARAVGITYGRVPALLRWSTGLSEVYINWNTTWSSPATAQTVWFSLRNQSSGSRVFDVINSGTDAMALRYNASGTMTNIATPGIQGNFRNSGGNVGIRYTWYFKTGSSGVVRLYMKGALIFEYTGNFTAPDSTFDELYLGGPNASENQRTGSIIVSDNMLIDHRLNTLVPDGTGNSSDWAGDWNQLAANGERGIGTANIFAPVHTDTVNDKLLSTFGNIPTVISNHSINAVAISAMGALDAGATVTDVSFLARQSGTDYTLNSLGFVAGDGHRGSQQILHTTPAGGAWDATTLNALEFGLVAT